MQRPYAPVQQQQEGGPVLGSSALFAFMSVATLRRKCIMSRKLGLIGILLVLSAALGTPAWAQVQTGSIFAKATAIKAGRCLGQTRH